MFDKAYIPYGGYFRVLFAVGKDNWLMKMLLLWLRALQNAGLKANRLTPLL